MFDTIIYGAVGASIGAIVTRYLMMKDIDNIIEKQLTNLTQTDKQLMTRLGMHPYCQNSGCKVSEDLNNWAG